jgi:AhpC/TSA family
MTSQSPISGSPKTKVGRYLRRIGQALLFVLVGSLLLVNALLIKQNRRLKAVLASNQPELLKEGDRVPSFGANTLTGNREVLNYAEASKTVLLVFSPDCNACERSAPYWKAIQYASTNKQYKVFGLSLGEPAKSNLFLAANGLTLKSFVGLDE